MTRLHAAMYALWAVAFAVYVAAVAFHAQAVIVVMMYASLPLWLGPVFFVYWWDNVHTGGR